MLDPGSCPLPTLDVSHISIVNIDLVGFKIKEYVVFISSGPLVYPRDKPESFLGKWVHPETVLCGEIST